MEPLFFGDGFFQVFAEVAVFVFLGGKKLDIKNSGDRINNFSHVGAAGF